MASRIEPASGGWSEDDSRLFQDYGRIFVPERETQVAIIADLIAAPGDGVWLVDLCCGAGLLTEALLGHFPEARVLALDGSESMLAQTRDRALSHAARLETRVIDLAKRDWRNFDRPIGAVVSSLAIHHLDGAEKQRLFTDMANALEPDGCFVIADLVAPGDEAAKRIAADAWDQEVRRRSLELDGDLRAFEYFQSTNWNLFSDPDPDPMDKPSSLLDQLFWLRDAGFSAVDVHWMKAGHALFSGRKQTARTGPRET